MGTECLSYDVPPPQRSPRWRPGGPAVESPWQAAEQHLVGVQPAGQEEAPEGPLQPGGPSRGQREWKHSTKNPPKEIIKNATFLGGKRSTLGKEDLICRILGPYTTTTQTAKKKPFDFSVSDPIRTPCQEEVLHWGKMLSCKDRPACQPRHQGVVQRHAAMVRLAHRPQVRHEDGEGRGGPRAGQEGMRGHGGGVGPRFQPRTWGPTPPIMA